MSRGKSKGRESRLAQRLFHVHVHDPFGVHLLNVDDDVRPMIDDLPWRRIERGIRHALQAVELGVEHDSGLLTSTVGMKVGQPHAREREFIEIRGRDFAAEGTDIGVTEIVGDDEKNVGRSSDLL